MANRILTTHVGSLPRPHDLLDMMKARLSGAPYDRAAYDARVRDAVSDVVGKQLECGIDIVADGEQSKPGFFTYVRERLKGFEARPVPHTIGFALTRFYMTGLLALYHPQGWAAVTPQRARRWPTEIWIGRERFLARMGETPAVHPPS